MENSIEIDRDFDKMKQDKILIKLQGIGDVT